MCAGVHSPRAGTSQPGREVRGWEASRSRIWRTKELWLHRHWGRGKCRLKVTTPTTESWHPRMIPSLLWWWRRVRLSRLMMMATPAPLWSIPWRPKATHCVTMMMTFSTAMTLGTIASIDVVTSPHSFVMWLHPTPRPCVWVHWHMNGRWLRLWALHIFINVSSLHFLSSMILLLVMW